MKVDFQHHDCEKENFHGRAQVVDRGSRADAWAR
jgi:hypothetical protein